MLHSERWLPIIGCVFAVNIAVHGQNSEAIRTEGPGQAVGPITVGGHVFQMQTDVEFGKFNANESVNSYTYMEPGAVLRFGLGRTFEVNTAWGWRRIDTEGGKVPTSSAGLNASNVGFRVNIRDGNGRGPSMAFQFSEKLPISSDVREAKVVAPRYLLIAGMPLGHGFSAVVNIGGDHNGSTDLPKGIYAANLYYSFAKKWSTFVENYGSFGKDFNTRWDTGLTYMANNDLKFDLYGGWANNSGGSEGFINLGLSFRFLTAS